VAQFFNTAAQGGTWAFFINYGTEYFGLSNDKAAYFFSLSLVGMMVGRFLGTYLMQFIAPNRLLAAVAVANIGMCLLVAQHWGVISFVALILLNFFFSIMFPTIYSLGLKNLGRHKQLASSFIVMGVTGAGPHAAPGELLRWVAGGYCGRRVTSPRSGWAGLLLKLCFSSCRFVYDCQ
jgi:FHS family L-fucose permease-like MFS transporter